MNKITLQLTPKEHEMLKEWAWHEKTSGMSWYNITLKRLGYMGVKLKVREFKNTNSDLFEIIMRGNDE